MRNFTKLMLTAMLLVAGMGGVTSVKARTNVDMSTATASTNATWTSETNTFAWTAENEYIVIPGLSGDLTGCYLDFTISAECHIDIVYTDDSRTEGGWNGYGRFGSGGSKTQDLGFMAGAKINSVKEVRICSQSASGNLTVTNVSYYYPLKLDFNASGVATVPFKSIITSDGVTFDPVSGVVTNTDGTGYLAIELPSAGIDLSTIKRIDVTYTGDDSNPWADSRVLQSLYIHDNTAGNVNTWQGSRYGVDFTSFASKSSKVDIIRFNAGTLTSGTITISSIKFTSEFVACAKSGETVLNTLPWKKIDGGATETPAWNMNGTSDTYYGNDSGNATHYADLTDYSELRVYCNSNDDGFRAFFINAEGTGTNEVLTTAATWRESEKCYSLNLSTIAKWNNKVALKSIKSDLSWKGGKVGKNVENIVAYKAPAAGSAQYLITGKGLLDAATTTMLADATVTSIDVTGMTNVTATTLTSANPNCLFKANAGKLSNTKNVIVDNVCANLELTDGYPFKAPVNFTAGSASYTTTIKAEAQAGTLCLPFEATIPAEGVTAYTLAYANGEEATATLVETTIPANTPVLLNGSGSQTFTGSSVAITAGAAKTSEAMTGVYESTTVPQNSFVLQKQGDNVGFYKVASNDITISPFRAYMTAQNQGARIKIVYPGEITAVKKIAATKCKEGVVYNLNGQRITKATKGLYLMNGKKYVK